MAEHGARVRVAVVTSNSSSVLPGLLESLPGAMHGLDWELVVADNGSTDDSLAVIGRYGYSGTVVRLGRDLGHAAAVNTALAVPGRSDAVLVASPSVRLERGSVPRLLEALRASSDGQRVGIAAPRLTGPDGEVLLTQRRRPTVMRALGEALLGEEDAGRFARLGEMVTDPAAYDRSGEVDWALGSVLLISSSCLAAVGRWDESFPLLWGEADFALRAAEHGFATRFVADAWSVDVAGDAPVPPALWPRLVTDRVRLYAKHASRFRAGLFRAAVGLGEGLRALIGRPANRAAFAAVLRRSRWVTGPIGDQRDRAEAADAPASRPAR